ncbi:hypothetical protein DM02DRAFT_642767 [Periconia macrospinosa]|uniref:Zn(2)-C6 fungal-type domain-containing protein n=1 Tax=Periconia macrospinosa TaxID=97972 RepID=A0A2V1DNM1_9PLEO|nr:hypothetical protein DM02DRAFT_642767 [Periconia macrospinosa]
MHPPGRKRRVSTCISCYNRKQKCDRRYPCNHCMRRRRPEECVYNSPPATQFPNALPLVSEDRNHISESPQDSKGQRGIEDSSTLSFAPYNAEGRPYDQQSTLLEAFGYSEDSNSNTVALLKMWNSEGVDDTLARDKGVLPGVIEYVQSDLEKMPQRQILDFLIQYFVSELNWMKQLVHAPSFLISYQQWWLKDRPLSTDDVEFAVLILRICAYAAQFLPSSSHTIDRIHGLSLAQIRNVCSEVANNLANACVALDWKGSLVRVQHLLFAAVRSSCDGRSDRFWEGIAYASQAAQKAGIHRDPPNPGQNNWELEKEMRRRVFCCLYILDSHLSRQLDRVPFLPDNLVADMLPRMHLAADSDHADVDPGAPELFTERLMQVQLSRFWRSFGYKGNTEYDPTQAEQKYERFCTEYLPNVPSAFALKPDTQWDKHLPRLAMQRQLLYISIFDSICRNFRPLLLLKPNQLACLAQYKQVLLQAQKKVLAIAALKELEAISTLHSMFNGCHTRFGAIIFNTFEASVLTLTLCAHNAFQFDNDGPGHFLGLEFGRLTRKRLIKAAEKGLDRLQMLAEVSDMAASGARTLAQLLSTVSRDAESVSPLTSDRSSWSASLSTTFSDLMGFDCEAGYSVSSEYSNGGLLTESLPTMVPEDSYSDLQLPFIPLDFESI